MRKILKYIGVFLIMGGIVIIGLIYYPVADQEIRYRTLLRQAEFATEEEIIPQSIEFGLVIPKIGVNAQVFANVDSSNPDEYLPLLSQGVAHAKFSALPGEEGNVFIFAHSADSPLSITRYNAVFYLLGKLKPGDIIALYYQKQKYLYEVEEKKVVPPELVSDFFILTGERRLVLQTCYPPGTTINRLLVIAKETD